RWSPRCGVLGRTHISSIWALPASLPRERPALRLQRTAFRQALLGICKSESRRLGSAAGRGMRGFSAHRRRTLLVASAVLSLSGCVSLAMVVPAAGSSSKAPLLIAVEGPQSGAQAANGVDQLLGVRLAVNQLNARGGLWDGRKVAVFAADDKADAANAKAVARHVIAKRIRFVIGPYNSSVGIANLPIYRRNHVL